MRFKNDSLETFVRMQANLMGQAFAYDSLRPGQLTQTVAVDDTYDYCRLQVVTANDTLLFRPIDFVGEKLYRSGKLGIKVRIDTVINRHKVQARELNMISNAWRRKLFGQ